MDHGLDLGAEFHELGRAIRAAIRVVQGVADGAEEPSRSVDAAAMGVLVLVDLRLRDLGRALRGELDPGWLVSDHNRATTLTQVDGVVLPPWSADERNKEEARRLARESGFMKRRRS